VKILALLLFPLALLYGFISFIRNLLFDLGFPKPRRYPFPVISVGNLSMGGTGKTPHIEYLVRLLEKSQQIAVLSRGYGRKTRGFLFADETSNAQSIGDEPYQYYRKFKNIVVAVCSIRTYGISKIREEHPKTSVILLDDAYQHRWVKPGLNILLTDFRHLYAHDYVFPTGTLREFRSGAKRADIIIVTKNDKVLPIMLRKHLITQLKPTSNQLVLFSYITYGEWVPLTNIETIKTAIAPYKNLLLLTGIVNPYPIEDYLKTCNYNVTKCEFADHHVYSEKDVIKISNVFDGILSQSKAIVTTEKDAARLIGTNALDQLAHLPIYYIPIQIEFHHNDAETLSEQVNGLINKKTISS
jgi:tetraacyldisaccharide 4'-kinase